MAYVGHQFANFVPLQGDGRAILLGEVNGRDIQLKGAGRTPFSRRGDGRSALGPVLREYLVSEAMHALGIPTTRALMAIGSGELVLREEPEKSGIFTRVANSHLRIGTAQYFAGQRNEAGLQQLVDYANQRLYPENEDALDLLRSVISKQARLVAQWMSVGFIHGVMNTDNMSFSGETIDYGPCAFMDYFNPAQVYSYIDQGGRYSYQNQPGIAQWNLVRLAEALLPLFDPNHDRAVELAKAELEKYPDSTSHITSRSFPESSDIRVKSMGLHSRVFRSHGGPEDRLRPDLSPSRQRSRRFPRALQGRTTRAGMAGPLASSRNSRYRTHGFDEPRFYSPQSPH